MCYLEASLDAPCFPGGRKDLELFGPIFFFFPLNWPQEDLSTISV